ncbi:MAG: hemerythrin family protein [Spirochaetes bacterium]|nr:bacteriohemerythrin [Spirochaetota bacterium]NMB63747.1 hemerythrin family protein [Spirochaetota bacterium]HOJ29913.1 bacteriohemerythrin [Spirochaetota bacterium]HOM11341.1 bacteriohemerythrin [Spirochaetota bacterium]HPP51150.1 bacteriohemerythrin [Spirochaetota bacterium]
MEFIEWGEHLSVGVTVFDNEHKQLVSLVNKLNHALLAGSAKKTMEEILQNLVNYTKIHFKHEEDYMVLYDYPEYEKHKKEHDALTDQVMDFYMRYQAGKTVFSLELMNFLKDWLTNHILISDKKYKNFFQSKNVE